MLSIIDGETFANSVLHDYLITISQVLLQISEHHSEATA